MNVFLSHVTVPGLVYWPLIAMNTLLTPDIAALGLGDWPLRGMYSPLTYNSDWPLRLYKLHLTQYNSTWAWSVKALHSVAPLL